MRALKTSTTVLAAALALAGCSFIPTYERPASPVPAALPTDRRHVGSGFRAGGRPRLGRLSG